MSGPCPTCGQPLMPGDTVITVGPGVTHHRQCWGGNEWAERVRRGEPLTIYGAAYVPAKNDVHALAAIMRRILTDDRMYVGLGLSYSPEVSVSGTLELSDVEYTLVRRIMDLPEPEPVEEFDVKPFAPVDPWDPSWGEKPEPGARIEGWVKGKHYAAFVPMSLAEDVAAAKLYLLRHVAGVPD
jgi:hypothetical protein